MNTMSIATNFARVGISNEDFLSIKSPHLLTTWSYKITQNIIAAVSLLPQGLWPLNLGKS